MIQETCEIFKNQHPEHLFYLIPVGRAPYTTRNEHNLPVLKSKRICLKNPFFSSTVSEWNKLNPSLQNSESFLTFKKNILLLVKLAAISVYDFSLITRLRLGLSHLRKHKFKHNFQESLDPLCNCGHDIESTTHFFLHCPLFTNEELSSIECYLLNNTNFVISQTLLFGNLSFNSNKNL